MVISPMNARTNLVDHFLIAMPQLHGSYFARSVIYVWRHAPEGALGLVINSPLEMQLSEIFEQLDIDDRRPFPANQTVLSGGPVETDKGFILHDSPTLWSSTIEVAEGLRITTSRDILADIGRGTGPQNYLVALGCAGWGPGQLEQEIVDNVWLVCPANKDIIFSSDFQNKVDLAASTMGFNMVQLTPTASYC